MNKQKRKTSMWVWIVLVLVIAITAIVISLTLKGSVEKQNLAWMAGQVGLNTKFDKLAMLNGDNGTVTIKGVYLNAKGNWIQFSISTSQWQLVKDSTPGLTQLLATASVAPKGVGFGSVLISFLPLLIIILIYVAMFKAMAKGGAGGANIFGMGKNRAHQIRTNVKFSDVGGIQEEKTELIELVDYFKNSKRYSEAGAKAPKGVLLEGPPGTGKTLLAKAVAGEAGVPFFSISGSEFEEMFAGVGASRVRDMFAEAKKAAPCIIFIDEIDAVGSKRFGPMGARGNEQTLNQLLVEMDGFDTNSGVIVMGATNRADVLDSALLRPGRFDRVIQVSLPDIREREEILKLHSRGKKISSKVNWHNIASRTPGFSGAQLANVLNEAAILMVRENKTEIGLVEIDEAIDRVVGGPAKKTRAMSQRDKSIVSYHESGHALVGLKLENANKVQKVTIIPRGNAGGYTISTPKEEQVFSSKKDLVAMIAGYLGGRAAEEIVFGADHVTTGAHDDLDKATNIARKMVVQFGMSKLGMTKYLTMSEEAYGKLEGTYSDETATKIDHAIQEILDESYKEALRIINDNRDELELLAESLRTLETITAEQIEYIDQEMKLPAEVLVEKERNLNEERKREAGDIFEVDLTDVKVIEEKDSEMIEKTNKTEKTDEVIDVEVSPITEAEVVEEPKPSNNDDNKDEPQL
ncbi:ATP-dependent zinc metalloprotease FtsH [Entomoplasma freundtii]|uniref:ATP-dependent zinc metalloprotease FtsH n=1 Tax=Entomoplasma freundtii TaxID=74700 RepID=UPI000C290D79|nr:ATP-dependent zinc metalloprotease FtsH [Entomoplasma freundtii]